MYFEHSLTNCLSWCHLFSLS